MASDVFSFFRAWIGDPLRVASIVPSGNALARLITRDITAQTGPVIELGPGTGVFTYALLQRDVAERDLTLVEAGGDFARLLEARFPQARICRMDAARLREAALFDTPRAGAVVSGLPILAFPARKVILILKGAFGYLRPGGAFYQFTYGPSCPVPRPILDRLDLEVTRIGTALRNVPPATVYRIARRDAQRPAGL